MKTLKHYFPSFFGAVLSMLMFSSQISAQVKDYQTRSFSSGTQYETFEGTFQSLMGVRNNLSCYCYNVGYLTVDDETRIAVCFKEETEKITCTRLKVVGSFQDVTIEPESTNPCPAGTRKIFMVKKMTCLD